jgi:hypothetical protein
LRSVKRTRNAVLYNNHQDIEILLTNNGREPMNYPARALNIANIPNDEVISLLQAYELDTNGNDDSQRRRLAEFLGVMLP